jgi:hypothetical protein
VLGAYADENVVGPLVHALRKRGLDVVTVADRGRRASEDALVLADALYEGRLMLTNDSDFLALAATSARRGERFAPILFWPQQRRMIRQLVPIIVQIATSRDYTSICSQVFFL